MTLNESIIELFHNLMMIIYVESAEKPLFGIDYKVDRRPKKKIFNGA